MKNLFNDISQDEKNRILEMHSGKKNVISEQGVIFPTPNKEKRATPEMLGKVLEKLKYQLESGGGLKWVKVTPEKNVRLSVTFNPEYAVVKTNNIKQPTQTGTDGKVHGMGVLKPSKKFPLLLKPNTLKEFENFLKDCEK